MKKLLLLFLISSSLHAEIYSCKTDFLAFTLKRVIYSETFHFQYQTNDEIPLLYSITRETDEHLYLMRAQEGSASLLIVGKKDDSFVGVYLKHEESSDVFNGECFLVG